jgi:hypothetical protein
MSDGRDPPGPDPAKDPMDNAIHTLHQFMLRTESLTYILVVAALVGLPFFWRFLNERDDDGGDGAGGPPAGHHH